MEHGLGRLYKENKEVLHTIWSLNPYFNGTWSRTTESSLAIIEKNVLILILMEHGLGQLLESSLGSTAMVLILILMEHGLGHKKSELRTMLTTCLNPYFNGTWSRTAEIHKTLISNQNIDYLKEIRELNKTNYVPIILGNCSKMLHYQ